MKTTIVRRREGDGSPLMETRGCELTKPGVYKLAPCYVTNDPKWRVVVCVNDFDPTKIVRLLVEEGRPIRAMDPNELRPFVPVTNETLTVTFSV